jgi:hypothetical protein
MPASRSFWLALSRVMSFCAAPSPTRMRPAKMRVKPKTECRVHHV